MTTLATDNPRSYELGDHNDIPAIAADIIYEGAAVGVNGSGYARPLVAGDVFGGFALRQCDNSSGVAGATNVRTLTKGQISLSVTGLTIDDIGKPVYASDDNTFTMTEAGNTLIGTVKRWISDGSGVVDFVSFRGRTATPVFSGKITWSGSGASLNATVTGVLTTDIVVASIDTPPSQAAYLSKAHASAADTIALTLSAANTSNDAVISYTVFRAVV